MKKRFLSLLCVLALCLGLLPVSALAADGIELYVGGQLITESGCYEKNQDGTWTKVDGTEPASGQFSYDTATFTLTLNQAEISYDSTLALGTKEYYGSVIAYSPSADVSLNIVVSQGTSTITGKGGIRVESTTGNASLSIKGPGSLDVEPKGSNSGITLYSSKNTNLDIDGADVTASSPDLYGVYLISSTDASSTSTITVNNGSLTTGGNGNVGIYYYWSGTRNAGTSSLTVSGNAVVDTRNSQIMAQNKETVVQVGAGSDGNGGIVFNGKSGTVYGKVELQDDLTINEGETLTVGKDASLTVPGGKTLTNDGTVTTEEGGTLTGNITNAPPKITTTTPLPDGTVGTVYNQQLAAENTPTQWRVTSGPLPAGLTLNGNTISGTPTTANTYKFTVTATNASGSDSKEFTLTISEPAPIYTISADVDPVGAGTVSGGGKYTAGTSVTLTATNNPGYRFVGWVESGTTVSTNPNYTFVANSNRSLTAQFDRISSGGGDSDPTYSITLPSRVTGGELKLSRRYAEKGETVTLTAVPDEGYELDTLTVTDSKGKEIDLTHKGGNEYTFKMPAGRVEIEVSFREIEVELPFTDVPEGAWYADAAAYVYEHGLMAGTSATTFAPDATTSRSMIATILWRMAGSPVVNYAMDYTDVAQGQWYSEAIRWAASEGIVGGYGNGLFGTNDPITREQFAVMLYRFAQEQGYDVSIGENTNILSYTDVADLSEYAISAMQWAVGAGIINGTGDGSTLSPQGQATRAQAAVMLMRFCEEYVTW